MKGTRARKICSSKNEEALLGKLFKIAKHKWTSPHTEKHGDEDEFADDEAKMADEEAGAKP